MELRILDEKHTQPAGGKAVAELVVMPMSGY
jgi:hypothetical protein